MNSKIVIIVTVITIGVGAIVFGYFTVQSSQIDRTQFRQDILKVVSYPAFVSSFGPGPELARQFEKRTGIKVELINAGDPILVLNKLSQDISIRADVVIGIDQLLAKRALQLSEWKPLPKELFQKVRKDLIFEDGADSFLPMDWAPLTFIHKSEEAEGAEPREWESLEAYLLAQKQKSVAFQDPRSSTLGLQWSSWMLQEGLSPDILSSVGKINLAASWSQAYGFFKRGSVDEVFSYMTSVLFHWQKEKDLGYSYAVFKSGHPFQVNAIGVLGRCETCDYAVQFVEFLLEPGSQAVIAQKDFMFPALAGLEIGGDFAKLADVQKLKLQRPSEETRQKIVEDYIKPFK